LQLLREREKSVRVAEQDAALLKKRIEDLRAAAAKKSGMDPAPRERHFWSVTLM